MTKFQKHFARTHDLIGHKKERKKYVKVKRWQAELFRKYSMSTNFKIDQQTSTQINPTVGRWVTLSEFFDRLNFYLSLAIVFQFQHVFIFFIVDVCFCVSSLQFVSVRCFEWIQSQQYRILMDNVIRKPDCLIIHVIILSLIGLSSLHLSFAKWSQLVNSRLCSLFLSLFQLVYAIFNIKIDLRFKTLFSHHFAFAAVCVLAFSQP